MRFPDEVAQTQQFLYAHLKILPMFHLNIRLIDFCESHLYPMD